MEVSINCLLLDPLKRLTGRAVRHIDDAAVGKALPQDAPLHHLIVGVGVDPQMGDASGTPVHSLVQHAPVGAVAADTVDRAVGRGRVPP